MANPIPTIGAYGIYQLKPPFDTQVKSGVSYKCVAVRELQDFVTIGVDPKALYYTKNNIDDSVWETDSNDPNTCIVSLVSDSNQWIYVPSSFVLAYPNLGGVPYTARVLGINLGAIPDGLDLSNLITNIQNTVKDTIGIQAQAKSVIVSDTKMLSDEDHNTLEAAREDLVNSSQTDRAQLLALQAENQAQATLITSLEDYIKNHLPADDSGGSGDGSGGGDTPPSNP